MKNEQPKNNVVHGFRPRHETDRRRFRANALLDTRHELIARSDQEEIINIYLLSAIGTLGIGSGFVCMIDKNADRHYFADRGFAPNETGPIEKNAKKIVQRYFPENLRNASPPPMEARLIPREHSSDHLFSPHQAVVLIQWAVGDGCLGLTGFGEKILPEAYDDEEMAFLLRSTYDLLPALDRARSASSISQLRLDLQQKNMALEAAIKQGEQSRADLDRRLFHLKSFYDIFHELSGLKDSGRIVETFLLMIVGILGAGQSYILLLDREEKTARMVCRGLENKNRENLSPDQVDTLMTRCFEYAEANNLNPMSARGLAGRSFWRDAARPLEDGIEILFVVNESYLGLIGLGNKITRQNFFEEEIEFLLALVHHLMVFLDNARSFETIRQLNIDLEKRNLELNRTIEHLGASKHKIEVLERAKAHVRSAIKREMEKTARMSAKDILLILCVSLILGLVFNFSNPVGVGLIPQNWLRKAPAAIDAHWAKLKHDTGTALFVDARPVEFFRQSHIQGAVNLPPALFDFVYMMNFGNRDTRKEIIVYGRNVSRRYDEDVLFKLVSRGHENVKVFPGGLSAWRANGFPLEP